MSELDLGLKVGVRRLLWSMGYSTRLDVELRGEGRSPRGRGDGKSSSGPETYTDLDVLGMFIAPGFQLTSTIADCKSGKRDRPTSRMFWARGVGDLFGADHVMLVREHDVNDATRQLSSRLGITVLPSADLTTMQQLYGDPIDDPAGPLSVLFDRTAVAQNLAAFTGLDRRLRPLLEYREFDYWVYDHHRNPVQLVAHLHDATRHLDPRNRIHLALFVDLTWQYIVTLVRACAYVQGAYLRDQDRGLQEYLFGGATNLQEKVEVANLLRSVAPAGVQRLDHLPPYYSQMRELVTRLMRRPNEIQTALRYAEVVSAMMAAGTRVKLQDAIGAEFHPVAAKLVADVCGFLVAAAGLDPEFRVQARAWLLGEPIAMARQPKQTIGTGVLEGRANYRSRQGDAPLTESSLTSSPTEPSRVSSGSSDDAGDGDADHEAPSGSRGVVSGGSSLDITPSNDPPKPIQGELQVQPLASDNADNETLEGGTSAAAGPR